MTADIDLPGLADELETIAGATINEADIIVRAVSALRAASAPDGVVAWQWKWRSSKEWTPCSRTFFDDLNETIAAEANLTASKDCIETRALYAAPHSFTSGHVAGQREMQERCKAAVQTCLIRYAPNCSGLLARQIDIAREDAIDAIASLPVSAGEKNETDGGSAVIEGDAVVIRFPLDAMQTAMDGAWSLRAFDTRYKITDINEFAKEFRNALNREDEQGTTEIHKMADRAFIDCIESGAFGIEEHEQQDI